MNNIYKETERRENIYTETERRDGLGMKGRIDPNSSVSLRTKVHRNGINGPNKKKIKFFQNLQQKTLDNISELYIDFYMQIWQMIQQRKSTRVQRWTNASRLNWNAGIFMLKTYFTQKPMTVTTLQKKCI